MIRWIAARLLLALLPALAPLPGWCASINVLWYTYADPSSIYIQTISKLAEVVHTLPKSGGLRWKLTFFRPDSPAPAFANYNVLVIQSGEEVHTGRYFKFLGYTDPNKPAVDPDYGGILKNKAAIESARGERTFISGSDADVHAINGDTGNAPPDPFERKQRVTCHPALTGPSCWDGALGHLVNAVNWAGSGRGLGIVSLVAAEHPSSRWWLDPNSFLRAELMGFVTIWGDAKKREDNPVIPEAALGFPLNSGLTSRGLSNWRWSFHAGFSHAIRGYAPIVNSTLYPGTAVAIATAKFAGAGMRGAGAAPPPSKSAPRQNPAR